MNMNTGMGRKRRSTNKNEEVSFMKCKLLIILILNKYLRLIFGMKNLTNTFLGKKMVVCTGWSKYNFMIESAA